MQIFKRAMIGAAVATGLAAMAAGGALAQERVLLAHALPSLNPGFAIASSLPVHLGYWEEEGLDVEVVTSPGAAAAIQLVIGGRADVAYGNPTTAMKAVQEGADVKFYYTSLRGDIFGIAIPADSDIEELADIKGKTIGVSSFASGGANYAKALMADAGVAEGEYDMIEIGVGGRAAAALEAGQVQALSLWDSAYTGMEERGIAFKKVIQDPRAQYFIAGSLTASGEDLEERRDMLIGVARGIAKAQLFQETNPEAAVRIHWEVYPQSMPRGGVTDEALASEIKVLDTRTFIQSRDAIKTGRFGDLPKEHMELFQDYLVTVGQLPEEIDVDRYYTNELIDEINDFDHDAIVEEARNFKMPE